MKASSESRIIHHIPIDTRPMPQVFALILMDIGPRIRPISPLRETNNLREREMAPPKREKAENITIETNGPTKGVFDSDRIP